MTVRVLRREEHLRMPWRNGGGITAQVASSPDDGLAQFDWRVSFAEVEHSGEFSTFPGVDRVIVLVDGPAMTLTVDGVPHELQRHRSFSFDGESRTECAVVGPTSDLNVMTRRGRIQADVELLELDVAPRSTRPADEVLVAVLAGKGSITQGGKAHELRARDVFASDHREPVTVAGQGTAAVICLLHS